MTDITKCSGEGCKKKKTCFRFTAPGTGYQSFFTEPPIVKNKCEYYWKIKIEKERSRQRDDELDQE